MGHSIARILLAEDNPGDVLLVKRALEVHRVECQLRVVRDGDAAMAFISQIGSSSDFPCPDVLLLDVNLPKSNGIEVLKVFRNHPACESTPVIVVSSSDAPIDRDRVAQLGVYRYFRKSTDLRAYMELGVVVNAAIAAHRAGRQRF